MHSSKKSPVLNKETLDICCDNSVADTQLKAVIADLKKAIEELENKQSLSAAALDNSASSIKNARALHRKKYLATIKTLEKSLLECYLADNVSEKKTVIEALRVLQACLGGDDLVTITFDRLLVFLLAMPSAHAASANVFYQTMKYLCAGGGTVELPQDRGEANAPGAQDSAVACYATEGANTPIIKIKVDDICRTLFLNGLQLEKQDEAEHGLIAASQDFARRLWRTTSPSNDAKMLLLAKWWREHTSIYSHVVADSNLNTDQDICHAAGRVTLEAYFKKETPPIATDIWSLQEVKEYRMALYEHLRDAIRENPDGLLDLAAMHEWQCLQSLCNLCDTNDSHQLRAFSSIATDGIATELQAFNKIALTSPYQKLALRAVAAVLVCAGVCAIMACTGGAAALAALGVNAVLIASGGVGVAAGLSTGILSLRTMSSSAGEKALLLLSLVLLAAGLCVLMACTGGGAAVLAALSAFVVNLSVAAPTVAIASGGLLTAAGVGVGLFSVKRKPHESSAAGVAKAICGEQHPSKSPAAHKDAPFGLHEVTSNGSDYRPYSDTAL